jgi:hypothetical protein
MTGRSKKGVGNANTVWYDKNLIDVSNKNDEVDYYQVSTS